MSDLKTRDCLRCGRGYYDDGYTWCPNCDSASQKTSTARDGVRALREREQALLKKRADDAEEGRR